MTGSSSTKHAAPTPSTKRASWWEQRSLYWRTVTFHAVLVITLFSSAVLFRPGIAVAFLFGMFVLVVALSFRLRCPKCGCLVNVEVFKTKLWNHRLPSHCMQCQWPTNKPAPSQHVGE